MKDTKEDCGGRRKKDCVLGFIIALFDKNKIIFERKKSRDSSSFFVMSFFLRRRTAGVARDYKEIYIYNFGSWILDLFFLFYCFKTQNAAM